MGGEPEPAALRVTHSQPLDRRCLLLGLLTHPDTLEPRKQRSTPRAFGRGYCVGWTPLRGVCYPVVRDVSSMTKLVARLESSVPVKRTVTVLPVKAAMLKLRCT